MNYNELSALSDKFNNSINPSIIQLPAMQVLSSLSKENHQASDPDDFIYWLEEQGIPVGRPGWHEQFEFQRNGEDVIILRVSENSINESEYWDYHFQGGLFAVINSYTDEDLEEQINNLISYFDNNENYEVAYNHKGDLIHEVLIENLVSPDNKRELVSLFVPVKESIINLSEA